MHIATFGCQLPSSTLIRACHRKTSELSVDLGKWYAPSVIAHFYE